MLNPILSSCLLLAIIGISAAAAKKPNVLVIMADDQDYLLNSLDVMTHVKSLIIDQGVKYAKHYCTTAWCCPSRVNFLTGRAAHNTNVTGLAAPYGGWPKFAQQNLNDNYLPVWLQAAGIKIYYAGKFMNAYGKGNFQKPTYPKAWDDSTFLVDPFTYNYMNSQWAVQHNMTIEKHPNIHTTLILQKKALAMLDTAIATDDQFFMMVAPVAPHVQVGAGTSIPPAPPMFKGKFAGQKAPRTPNFNPDVPSGSSWIKAKAKLTPAEVAAGDDMHVHRLENIAGIDYMVSLLIDKLDKAKILDNTYILYTSDNGFHIGNHRLKPGKRCPYEEDINIPLLIRGPNVPKGEWTDIHNSRTDVAPTILKMMGVQLRNDFDGAPIAYTKKAINASTKHEHVNVEFWDGVQYNDRGVPPHPNKIGYYFNGTYKALRFRSGGSSFYYSVWCTGEREFHDMTTDFYQMTNRLAIPAQGPARSYFGRAEDQLFSRPDAILLVLKNCKQDSCRNAWNVLFPKNTVNDITAAMAAKYDKFFADQPKVHFYHCVGGHIIDAEGPMNANVYRP